MVLKKQMTFSIRKESEEINKLLQDASVLCDQGQWESALLLYRRGLQLRPHSMACRVGVQRASYVIKNTIKGLDKVNTQKYEHKGENESKEVKENSEQPPNIDFPKAIIAADDKRAEFKELCKDIKFLQTAKQSSYFPNNKGMDNMIEHLNLLMRKSKIWSKQKPELWKSSNYENIDPDESKKCEEFLENLESISDSTQLLHSATNFLTTLEKANIFEHDKISIKGQLYYLILKANVDLGNFENAIVYKKHIMKIANDTDDEELSIRASYLEGRAHALSGNYCEAAKTWQNLVKMTTNPDRLAHLLHEVGRCYFKMDRMESSRAYGVLSLKSAREARNNVWIKNAAILIAQIEVIRGYVKDALEYYEIAEAAARRLRDQRALFSIICETSKLGKKLRRPKVDDKSDSNVAKSIPNRGYQSTVTSGMLRRPKIVSPTRQSYYKKAKVEI